MSEAAASPPASPSIAERLGSAVMDWYRHNVLGEPTPEDIAAREQEREAELRAIAERLEPAAMDWYQRHVLGEDSALRPPADLISSVSFRSPHDDPLRADYTFETHTIHMGALAMERFRGFHDALPFVVAHELGHAVQRTAAERALDHGEARDAPFTAQTRDFLDAADRYNGSVELSENSAAIYDPQCRSPAELRTDHAAETSGVSLARRLHVAELAQPVFRASERIEGYADDFASDVVRASYEPRVAREMLGEAAQFFGSSSAQPRCDASRDDDPRARADDDHRPLRLYPAPAHRVANILGDGGPNEVPLARSPVVSTASADAAPGDRDPASLASSDQRSSLDKLGALRAERARVASRLETLDRDGADADRSSPRLSASPRVRGHRALRAPSLDAGASPEVARSQRRRPRVLSRLRALNPPVPYFDVLTPCHPCARERGRVRRVSQCAEYYRPGSSLRAGRCR